jgi:hypothetical protein
MKITNNQLNYSQNGLIYNYETIKDKIGKESADKFNSIKINIGNSDKIEASLFNFNGSGDLKNDLESITNILLELSSVSDIEEDIGVKDIGVKDIGEGLPKNFLIKQSRPFDMSRYRVNTPRYGDDSMPRYGNSKLVAGTVKNKKDRYAKKTRNNKIKNKKISIKKRENKIKRNTRRN